MIPIIIRPINYIEERENYKDRTSTLKIQIIAIIFLQQLQMKRRKDYKDDIDVSVVAEVRLKRTNDHH